MFIRVYSSPFTVSGREDGSGYQTYEGVTVFPRVVFGLESKWPDM